MSGDDDLIKLYSQRILALAAEIPLTERLRDPQVTARKRSPLCGSTVTVDLALEDGRIAAFGQDVKACALGPGLGLGARAARDRRAPRGDRRGPGGAGRDAQGGRPGPGAPFEELEVLRPARDYRNRHASILLAWDATLAAFDEAVAAAWQAEVSKKSPRRRRGDEVAVRRSFDGPADRQHPRTRTAGKAGSRRMRSGEDRQAERRDDGDAEPGRPRASPAEVSGWARKMRRAVSIMAMFPFLSRFVR